LPASDNADTKRLHVYLHAGLERLASLARTHGFRIFVAKIDASWTPQITLPEVVLLDFAPVLRAVAVRRNLRFTYDGTTTWRRTES